MTNNTMKLLCEEAKYLNIKCEPLQNHVLPGTHDRSVCCGIVLCSGTVGFLNLAVLTAHATFTLRSCVTTLEELDTFVNDLLNLRCESNVENIIVF